MAGSSNGSDDDGLIAGINVTPLVDVTLVLLIIFMVTARIIASQGLAMDLPKAAKSDAVQVVFSVELLADGRTRVDSNFLANDEEIRPKAKSAWTKDNKVRAVIRADSTVDHGRVIHVLDLLKREKIEKIAFAVSKIPEGVPVEAAPPQK